MPKLTPFYKQLLYKILLFSVLFIIVSGITGSWVVGSRLLYGFDFYLYANLGKMILVSIVVFALLIRDRLKELETIPKAKINIPLLIGSFLLVPVFFYLGGNLIGQKSFSSDPSLSLLTHLTLIAIPSLLLIGSFGYKFLIAFAKKFKKELLICLGISIVFDILIFQVWKLWPFFSTGVLNSVKFLLSLTFENVIHIPPFTLLVNGFGVAILQACSGLDSLFMFTALYALIGLIDHKKLKLTKYFLLFPLAALGMYFINILRVYILIVIGATISPEFAINMFHTYAGMVLFLIYFGIFWKFAYKWMRKDSDIKAKPKKPKA